MSIDSLMGPGALRGSVGDGVVVGIEVSLVVGTRTGGGVAGIATTAGSVINKLSNLNHFKVSYPE